VVLAVTETYHAKALLSVIRDKTNMKYIVLINVHSPRGVKLFNESILELVSKIPQNYPVIFAGEFNDNLVDYPLSLNIVLCGTNEDELKKKNLDFVGSRNGIMPADVVRYNSSKDFKELITRTFWNGIFHHFKKMAAFDETEDPKVEHLGSDVRHYIINFFLICLIW